MAKYNIKAYSALCGLEDFTINGIDADYSDFVDKYDHAPESACDYGCGDMRCDVIKVCQEILDKYNITAEEYYDIAYNVAEELDFGSCGWCV